MSDAAEIARLREELRASREREAQLARTIGDLERDQAELRAQIQSRFASENDPISINARLRRLEEEAGTVSDGGGSTPGTPATGDLGAGWGAQTPSQKLETLRANLCAILGALNGATITCNEDGTVTLTLPSLPGAC